MSFRFLAAAAFWSFAVMASAADTPPAPAAPVPAKAGPPTMDDFFAKAEIDGPEVSP